MELRKRRFLAATLVIAVVIAVACLVLFVVYPARPGKRILFRWSNSTNKLPNCSLMVRTRCISGFTLTDVTSGNTVVSSTIGPTTTAYIYEPPDGIWLGYNHTFTLATNAISPSGDIITSRPATVTVKRGFWPWQGGSMAVILH